MIVYTHASIFIAYLRAGMERKNTANAIVKLRSIMPRPDSKVGFKCSQSIASDSCNGMRDVWQHVVEYGVVKWAYRFVAQALRNAFENIIKTCFMYLTKE